MTTEEKKSVGPRIVNGLYVFPPQISLDSRGRKRFCNFFVSLVLGHGTLRDQNWSDDDETRVSIRPEYISGEVPLPENTVAAYWSETGIEGGKTLRSAPTYIAKGKNLDKKNATNALTQAIADVQSRWDKKARKGGGVTDVSELTVVQSGRVKPMALHEFPPQPADGKFDISNQNYWSEGTLIYVSPKADGNRMMSSITPTASGPVVDLWGRAGDVPPNPMTKIREELARLYQMAGLTGTVIFDGEAYKPGMEHQEINSIYMNASANADALEYWIFDVVTDGNYSERIAWLSTILPRADCPRLILVPAHLERTSAGIEKRYKDYLRNGFEGAVLRLLDGKYEAGTRREVRSKYVLKLKPEYDAEFEIVGYTEGAGRDKGALIWVLKMPASDKTFTVRPKGTIEDRRALYSEMPTRFESAFKGKMMRVLFGDTTSDGIPRFPRAVGVREHM
jgi:DNA ligase-1